jgi:hypothetical protein
MKIGIVVSEFNYRDHWVNHEIYEQVLVSTLATPVAAGEPLLKEV